MNRTEIEARHKAAKEAGNLAIVAASGQHPEQDPRVIVAHADERAIAHELRLFHEGKPLEAALARVAHAQRRFDELSVLVQEAGRELHAAELAAQGLA